MSCAVAGTLRVPWPWPARGRRHTECACYIRLVSVALLCIPRNSGTHAAEAPLGRMDYLPYKVAVSVSFADDASITPSFRRRVCRSLTTRIVQTFGAAWQLSDSNGVRQSAFPTPSDSRGLARMTAADVALKLQPSDCDKAYFFVVWLEGPIWHVAGREWDRTLQSLGPARAASTADRRGIADAAASLLQRLFSPLLIVDDADREAKTAKLTVRAGAIPFGDSHLASLAKGDVLLPVFRFLGSNAEVRKIQPVPWTYLVLDSVEKGHARASVQSSYRAPLAANMRRRVDAFAVPLRPVFPATELKLRIARQGRTPLAGIFVSVSNESTTKKQPASLKLLSDRDGCVTIPVDPQHMLRRLEFHSGSTLLARRFFAPGIDAKTTIELPDDRLRLSAERDVDLLFSQMIEAVAKRASLIGLTRATVKREDAVAARQRLTELRNLPGGQYYSDELNKIRVLALEEADRRKDRLAARRIEELCQKSDALIQQYLPEDRLTAFIDEMNDALKAQADEAKERAAALAAKAAKARAVVKRPPKMPGRRPSGNTPPTASSSKRSTPAPTPAKPIAPGRSVGL